MGPLRARAALRPARHGGARRALRRVDLTRFDVIVLPSGDYADALGPRTVARLRDWVHAGGTLVALAEAARWATREKVELLATTPSSATGGRTSSRNRRTRRQEPPAKDKDAATLRSREGDPARARATRGHSGRHPARRLDREHWLAAGTDGEIAAIVERQRVFTPIKLDKGTQRGHLRREGRARGSGLVWDERATARAERPS